jgi:hypothetical protein
VKKNKKKLTGYRTILAAGLMAVLVYAQSDSVSQWVSHQPASTSLILFGFVAVLRAITTTPMFEDK